MTNLPTEQPSPRPALRVSLFVTCLADLFRPSVAFASIKLLEQAGCEVSIPLQQTCCGQPAYNTGDYAASAPLARRLIQQFAAADYVVVPSGSCAGMICHHYPKLLEGEWRERALQLAAKTFELTTFLHDIARLKRGERAPIKLPAVTYHDSCAGLREMGVKGQPRALLGKVAGLSLAEMAECETCCGFGGTFSVKFGEISARLADNKCQHVANAGADALVLGDLGCMLNIEGRLRRRGDTKTRVLHVAEVLAGERPGSED